MAAKEFAVGLAEFGSFKVFNGKIGEIDQSFTADGEGSEIFGLQMGKSGWRDLIENGDKRVLVEKIEEFS